MDTTTNPLTDMGPDERYTFSGSFLPNGAANPVAFAFGAAPTFSRSVIARTGVGTYTLTFTERHTAPVHQSVLVHLGTPADIKATVTSYAVGTTGNSVLSFTISSAAGIATDVAANANNTVSIFLVFRKRQVNG